MSMTLTLPPEMESSLREEALQRCLPLEEVAVRRLREAEILQRIFTYFPPEETREMHALARKQRSGTLIPEDERRLTELAQQREMRNAARFQDILTLAQLRGVGHRQILAELNIRPYRMA